MIFRVQAVKLWSLRPPQILEVPLIFNRLLVIIISIKVEVVAVTRVGVDMLLLTSLTFCAEKFSVYGVKIHKELSFHKLKNEFSTK